MRKREYGWLVSLPFFAVHALAIGGIIAGGWSWSGFALAVALYYGRMFGITAGYHRYFSHRTYRTSRVFQFVLALLGTLSMQKGVLWWSAHHRDHHKYSDTPQDVHSFRDEGFWWSHVGWILSRTTEETKLKNVPDLTRYPELRWLNKYHLVPGVLLGVALFFLGNGWQTLLWGLFVSTTMLWHATFTINSLSHWWGVRTYETTDTSKNNFFLALLTMGEGWHNNHHYYPRAVNNGFRWYQVDITYYVLRLLSVFGIVWDLHTPPQKVLEGTIVQRANVVPPRPVAPAATVDAAAE
jgi:stearoyl-CoA desaturase (delta-9 desaturase)